MFNFNQPESLIHAIRSFFIERDQPAPVRIRSLRYPELMAHYELAFESQEHIPLHLQVRLYDVDENRLVAPYLVSRMLVGEPKLPTSPQNIVLADNILGKPALISPFLMGRNGNALLREHPNRLNDVFGLLGTTIANLQNWPQTTFGTIPTPHGFLPERDSWRETWRERIYRRIEAIERGGMNCEPLIPRVIERIEERLPALDSAQGWGLVHGRLAPHNVTTLDEEGRLNLGGITGWEDAYIGDPISEWGNLMFLTPEALSAVLDGFGKTDFDELATDDMRNRLEVYALTFGLNILSEISSGMFDPKLASQQLEQTRQSLYTLLEPKAFKLKIDQAISAKTQASTVKQVFLNRPSEARRRVLLRLGKSPKLIPPQETLFNAAAATSLLPEKLTSLMQKNGYADITHIMLDMLPNPQLARVARPIENQSNWMQQQIDLTVQHHINLPNIHQRPSLVAVWLLNELIKCEATDVADHWLRGFETLLCGIKALEHKFQSQIPLPAPILLSHGLQAMAALQSLAKQTSVQETHLDSLKGNIEHFILDNWDVVEISLPLGTKPASMQEVLQYYSSKESQRNVPMPVGPLFLAILSLDASQLPAPAEQICAGLGFEPQR